MEQFAKKKGMLETLANLFAQLQGLVLSPFLPFPLLNLLHGLRVSMEYRRQLRKAGHEGQPAAWLQGIVATAVMSLGGTTMSGKCLLTRAG